MRQVRLHFGAVDYRCKVFVNGIAVGEHTGGYSSFFFDISQALCDGDNEITVYAQDDSRDPLIPSGKHSIKYPSHRCYYTRTTGIWQTVWLEVVQRDFNHPAIIGWCPHNETWDRFFSKYGGICWATGENDENRIKSWGYGKDVSDKEAFYTRYQGLTDVEQEQNGLYTYERVPKFDPERLRRIMLRKAAIEE